MGPPIADCHDAQHVPRCLTLPAFPAAGWDPDSLSTTQILEVLRVCAKISPRDPGAGLQEAKEAHTKVRCLRGQDRKSKTTGKARLWNRCTSGGGLFFARG
jgi:hypothetical protein